MAALLYHHSETSIARRSAPKGSAIVPFAGDLRSRDGRSGGLLPFRHGPDPAITEGRDRGWWGIAASIRDAGSCFNWRSHGAHFLAETPPLDVVLIPIGPASSHPRRGHGHGRVGRPRGWNGGER